MLTTPTYKLRQETSFAPTSKNTTGPRRSDDRGERGDESGIRFVRSLSGRWEIRGVIWILDLHYQKTVRPVRRGRHGGLRVSFSLGWRRR